MKNTSKTRLASKLLRHERTRKRITTGNGRMRLAVYKSNAHIFAQIIDDQKGVTLAASSTLQLKLPHPNMDAAKAVGDDIGKKAVGLGVTKIAFDTGGSTYHGRLKALADAARAAGLQF